MRKRCTVAYPSARLEGQLGGVHEFEINYGAGNAFRSGTDLLASASPSRWLWRPVPDPLREDNEEEGGLDDFRTFDVDFRIHFCAGCSITFDVEIQGTFDTHDVQTFQPED